MPRIVRLTPVSSVKPGPASTILPDGTIVDPLPYEAADVEFDDGIVVQVERPLTLAKLAAAWKAARSAVLAKLDGISVGDDVPPPT